MFILYLPHPNTFPDVLLNFVVILNKILFCGVIDRAIREILKERKIECEGKKYSVLKREKKYNMRDS